jgi:geranylgeranyl pyrophosphate synthase
VIFAFERASVPDRARLSTIYAAEAPSQDDVAEAMTILERAGARDYTRDQARRYRDEALAELAAAGVVEHDARRRLEDVIVGVISA